MQNLTSAKSPCTTTESIVEKSTRTPPSRALSNAERQQLFQQLKQHVQQPHSTISSGNTELDVQLGGGWPQGCLIEVLGGNYLQPLLPLLSELCSRQRTIAWIKPPFTPYPPALQQQGLPAAQQLLIQPTKPADTFWSSEQLLRTTRCGAVLAWEEPREAHTLRRLQLAAEAGNSIAILFRPASAQRQSSAAAVRLLFERHRGELHGKLLKARGGLPGKAFKLAELTAGLNDGPNASIVIVGSADHG